MKIQRLIVTAMLMVAAVWVCGCSDNSGGGSSGGGGKPTTLILNWLAEPEFGGFYAAAENRAYAKHGLHVTIKQGGAGTPGLDMVAAGHADFAIASADEVVIARSRGMDVVALFAVYQTCPQGLMVHKEARYDSIASLLAERKDHKVASLAVELGLPYVKFLQKKYGLVHVKIVPFAGGIAQFMVDPLLAQQCFITSEPFSAKQQGADPQVFLIAETGYNPYTTVVVTRRELLTKEPAMVRSFVEATREGWQAYMKDPSAADAKMRQLNPTLSPEAFTAAAEAQKPLIVPADKPGLVIGSMTAERWQTLCDQLFELDAVDKEHKPTATDCFVDVTAGAE